MVVRLSLPTRQHIVNMNHASWTSRSPRFMDLKLGSVMADKAARSVNHRCSRSAALRHQRSNSCEHWKTYRSVTLLIQPLVPSVTSRDRIAALQMDMAFVTLIYFITTSFHRIFCAPLDLLPPSSRSHALLNRFLLSLHTIWRSDPNLHSLELSGVHFRDPNIHRSILTQRLQFAAI